MMKRSCLLLFVMACDDGATQQVERDAASEMTLEPTRDAASNVKAPDATFDAAPDAGRDAGAAVCDLVCADDSFCQFTHCTEPACVPQKQCARFVDDCALCSVFEQCLQPLCVKSPEPCLREVCEPKMPSCGLGCRTGYQCTYNGADCDDAGACEPIEQCVRSVDTCDACTAKETCTTFVLDTLAHSIVCIAN